MRNGTAGPTQDGNGTWSFIVDLGPGPGADGEWRDRRQARRRGFRTKRKAQDALDELRVDSRQGTYVTPTDQHLGEYLENDWLPAVKRQLAQTTWESYERNVRHHIVPHLGGLPLQAIDPGHLNRFYATLLESGRVRGQQSDGLSPRTVRYIATILGKALDDAVKWRRLQVNPAKAATPPSAKAAKSPEMQTWTAAQLSSFITRTADDRYGPAFHFLATTGCRRGEALGLRWSDLDLDSTPPVAHFRQQVLPLPKPSGKGREGRIVPGTKTSDARVVELDAHTVVMLRRWKANQAQERLVMGSGFTDHGLVFAMPDGWPYHPERFSRTFTRRLAKASFSDLPAIRLHDLRHTWATLALEAGVDVAVVSKRLGHSSPVVTWSTYQHVRQGMQSDAAERVAGAIFGS